MATRKTSQPAKLKSISKGGRLKPGQAPPVAMSNALHGRLNAVAKLKFLTTLLVELSGASEVGESRLLLDMLPCSVAQFNRWCIQDVPEQFRGDDIKFNKGSNATLNKNSDVRDDVILCIQKISEIKKGGNSAKKKEFVVRLKERLRIAVALREIAERELVRSRKELLEVRGELLRVNASIDSIVETVNEDRDQMLREIAALAKIHPEAASLLRGRVKLIGG